MVGASNGVAAHGHDMLAMFPEALISLAEADPEVAAIIENEKRRQWCVRRRRVANQLGLAAALPQLPC